MAKPGEEVLRDEAGNILKWKAMTPAQYERWKDLEYGKKYQINGETFTLADGTVIPVWRRTKTPGPKDVPFKEAK